MESIAATERLLGGFGSANQKLGMIADTLLHAPPFNDTTPQPEKAAPTDETPQIAIAKKPNDQQLPTPKEKWSFPFRFFKTLMLFTKSDLGTFVAPVMIFALSAATSNPSFETIESSSYLAHIAPRIPAALFWTWTNTLIFDFANQRSPASASEDRINKPSRPIPAGRITCEQTRKLLMWSLPVVLLIHAFMGVWEETALLFMLTWMYNDLGGSDDGWLVRNLIISVAYYCYNLGCTRVLTHQPFETSTLTLIWLPVTSSVILTTMHFQDLKDVEGDRQRNRKTAPLVLGDTLTRWTLGVSVLFWSVSVPALCRSSYFGYTLTGLTGLALVLRLAFLRGHQADKRTWWLWALWIMTVWIQPPLGRTVYS